MTAYQQQAEHMIDKELIHVATSKHGTKPDYNTIYPTGLHTAAREEIIKRFIKAVEGEHDMQAQTTGRDTMTRIS